MNFITHLELLQLIFALPFILNSITASSFAQGVSYYAAVGKMKFEDVAFPASDPSGLQQTLLTAPNASFRQISWVLVRGEGLQLDERINSFTSVQDIF